MESVRTRWTAMWQWKKKRNAWVIILFLVYAAVFALCQLVPCTIAQLLHCLASSTCSTYRTGQKSFIDFMLLHPQFHNMDSSILPASQATLLEWVTWLEGVRRIQPNTNLSFSACESLMLQRLIVKNRFST